MENKNIKVYNNGKTFDGNLEINQTNNLYKIVFTIRDQQATGTGSTILEAINQIRHVIEPAGLLLGINASRLTAGPAYQVKGEKSDLVSIFTEQNTLINVPALSEAPENSLGTIKYQQLAYDKEMSKYLGNITTNETLTKETKLAKKVDKNRFSPFLGLILAAFSTGYPFLFALLAPNTMKTFTQDGNPFEGTFINPGTTFLAWIIAGLFLYGLAITVAIENMMISRKTSFSLLLSISGPPIVLVLTIVFVIITMQEQIMSGMVPTITPVPLPVG